MESSGSIDLTVRVATRARIGGQDESDSVASTDELRLAVRYSTTPDKEVGP